MHTPTSIIHILDLKKKMLFSVFAAGVKSREMEAILPQCGITSDFSDSESRRNLGEDLLHRGACHFNCALSFLPNNLAGVYPRNGSD